MDSKKTIHPDISDTIVNFGFIAITIIVLIETYVTSKFCKFYLETKEKRPKKILKLGFIILSFLF